MKKFTLFIISLFLFSGVSFAQDVLYTTTVFDFSNNVWNIPEFNLTTNQGERWPTTYRYNGVKIKISPNTTKNAEFYYDNGFLRLTKTGSKIVLPAFEFPVEKIVLVGHPSGSDYPTVDMNVYVGGVAVSTPSVGTTDTYTYEIDAEHQEAGKVYELIIGSGGGEYSSVMFITAIKVYPAVNRLDAPVFDMPAGVYTEPITVKLSTPTADIAGVSDVIYYYTTDGCEPDAESDETEGEIEITESCTLKAAVELVYKDSTYISESTSVEYIISKNVEGIKAGDIVPGKYFMVADNKLATLYNDECVETKDVYKVQDGKIIDALYYAFTIENEKNGNGIVMKDGAGNYISVGLYPDPDYPNDDTKSISKLVGSKHPVSGWTAYMEDGVAKISSNDSYLVYDSAKECFTLLSMDAVTEQTVFPVLYKYVPLEVLSVEPNGVVEALSTILLQFNKQIVPEVAMTTPEPIVIKDVAGTTVATVVLDSVVAEDKTLILPLDKEIVKVGKYTMELPVGFVADVNGNIYEGGSFSFEVFRTLECVTYTPVEIVDTLSEMTLEFDDVVESLVEASMDVLLGDNVVATIDTKDAVINENSVKLLFNTPIITSGVYTVTVPADVVVSVLGACYGGGTFTFEVVAKDVEDGIERVENNDVKTTIYDLSGRRVKEITVKGIYIVNGKKVIK